MSLINGHDVSNVHVHSHMTVKKALQM